jgi:hypothetical protein
MHHKESVLEESLHMPITAGHKRNTCVYKMTDVPTFLRHVLLPIHMCVKADQLILTQTEHASYSSVVDMLTFTLTKYCVLTKWLSITTNMYATYSNFFVTLLKRQMHLAQLHWRLFFLIGKLGGEVQLGPLGTAATNRSIVPAPGDYDGEIGVMMIGRGNWSTWRKPAPVPRCPPQTPHASRTRTRAAAMGSQRLTAWATARPHWRLVEHFIRRTVHTQIWCKDERPACMFYCFTVHLTTHYQLH